MSVVRYPITRDVSDASLTQFIETTGIVTEDIMFSALQLCEYKHKNGLDHERQAYFKDTKLVKLEYVQKHEPLVLRYPTTLYISFENIDRFLEIKAFDVPSETITIQMLAKQLDDYVTLWNACFPEHKQTTDTADFVGVKLVLR